MSIELAVRASKQLEGILESELGATGKGLHEKVTSVERHLPDSLIRKLRRIATIRNNAVHNPDYEIEDPDWFSRFALQAADELRAHAARHGRPRSRAAGIGDPPNRPTAATTRQPRWRGAAMLLLLLLAGIGVWRLLIDNAPPAPPPEAASIPLSEPATGPKTAPTPHAGARSRDGATAERKARPHRQLHERPATPERAKREVVGRPNAGTADAGQGPSPADLQAAEAGDGVALRPNAAIGFDHAAMVKSTDAFGSPVWKLRAKLVNNTSRYLSSVDAEAVVHLPGRARSIGPVNLPIYFDARGLAPGATDSIDQQLGGSFGAYDLQTPDVLNAATLGAVVTVRSVDDGLGRRYSPDSPHLAARSASGPAMTQPAGDAARRSTFSLAPNNLVAFSDVRLTQEPGTFGGRRWAVHATVQNLTGGYLESVDTEASVSVPGDASTINDVRQSIYFGSTGLAAGGRTEVDLRLGGSFNAKLGVPDVVNAKAIGVRMRVTSALDGMGNAVEAGSR